MSEARSIGKLTDAELGRLHEEWLSWLQTIANSNFRPTAAEDGTVSMLGSFARETSALEAIDGYYRTPQVMQGRLQRLRRVI